MRRLLFVVLAFALCAALPAFATVTFNPDTGTGFVGKGDVQTSFGWNNAMLQRNAGGVTFTFEITGHCEAVCTCTTDEDTPGEKTHNVEHHKNIDVNDQIGYQTRSNRQIDGFILTGWGNTHESGDPVPVVGAPCQGEGTGATWSSVTFTGSSGGLFVNWGTGHVQLFPVAP